MFSPDGTLISASAAPHCGGEKMSEADERVCIYAVTLTDSWDRLKKESNGRWWGPRADSNMILLANEGNREQE